MSDEPIRASKISDIIAKRLEAMILEGSLVPGQKMPPERELAQQFEVSRPSLREALHKLEAKGLVTRKQGGGTFVSAEIGLSFVDPLMQLFQTHSESTAMCSALAIKKKRNSTGVFTSPLPKHRITRYCCTPCAPCSTYSR